MANSQAAPHSPTPFDKSAWDPSLLPDYDHDFISGDDLYAFEKALAGSEAQVDDLSSTAPDSSVFITALNDWRPVYQRVRRTNKKIKKRKPPRRGKDETREGFVYTILKWPLFFFVMGWIICLAVAYLLTRLYIFLYEHFVTMRGKREQIRQKLRSSVTYEEWREVALEMDRHLGNDKWKGQDEYAYYNSTTIHKVRDELRRLRTALDGGQLDEKVSENRQAIVDDLRTLVEAAVKDNFVGVENSRLYSETFYGTKNLVQSFVDEVDLSLEALSRTEFLSAEEKGQMFRYMHTNYGQTALCLSGGATFAYYHFGVAKALLDSGVLPQVITGTSGGALVAALLATRTDDELRKLLVPALAHRITACHDSVFVWFTRWLRTGARFDSVDWAQRCSWFCRGSLTFREAYERTGRILNVTCIPSDPHSPTVLANYLTAPDCVIWSAVLASAAVPGILNPVVLMRKTRSGSIAPYHFGHKWKDGSLRTDIPLKALNTHFNVTFSIVSQVNPHINLFFFSSRGTVGRPVTHRRGRGWRGGFLGSATEQYLKLDLTKWLKVLRHLELLPRYFGQDWSEVWLQRFSGTVTIWPRSKISDFWYILSDPSTARLARMIHAGMVSAFPKLKFIENRMSIERRIEAGRSNAPEPAHAETRKGELRPDSAGSGGMLKADGKMQTVLSEDDLQGLLSQARRGNGTVRVPNRANHRASDDSEDAGVAATSSASSPQGQVLHRLVSPSAAETSGQQSTATSPTLGKRLTGWFSATSSPRLNGEYSSQEAGGVETAKVERGRKRFRDTSVVAELRRQSQVFFDDEGGATASEGEGSEMSLEEYEDADDGTFNHG